MWHTDPPFLWHTNPPPSSFMPYEPLLFYLFGVGVVFHLLILSPPNRRSQIVAFSIRRLGSQGPPAIQLSGTLAHQNRTIAIASDFRVDGAKSPEIPQKEGVLGSEIAARNRRSLATFHRTLKSQCIIAVSCLGNRAISGVRNGHRNRKSQKSLRFRCAKSGTRTTEKLTFLIRTA